MSDPNNPEVKEPVAPTPGTPEYDEAMAAKFRNGGEPPADDLPPEVPAMPEGGVEKFYDAKTGAYDWKSHAVEAEYRLKQSKGEKPDPQAPPEDNIAGDEDEVQDILAKAGLKPDELEKQIVEQGELAQEARKALVDQGIPEALIDSYVAHYRANVESMAAKALEAAGGEEGWKQLNDWAVANLTEAEQADYNARLAGPNWEVALKDLKARRAATSPTRGEGNLLTGDSGVPTATGYTSRAQMKADMADPRYKSDPAFRKAVMDKIQFASFQDEYR